MATIYDNSVTGRLVNQAKLNYAEYQQEKAAKAQDLGFVAGLTDRQYDRIIAEEQAIQGISTMLTEMQNNKQAFADLGMDEESINQLNSLIAEAADPLAMQYDLLTAVSFSQNLGISVDSALENLDNLIGSYLMTPVKRGKTALKAVQDSFRVGALTGDRGRKGSKLALLSPDSPEYKETLAELQAIDAEMESLADWMQRPWYVEFLKMGAQTLPYSLDSIAAGAAGTLLVKGAGLAFGGIPTAALMVASGIASSAFRFAQGFHVEAGNLYYDLVSQGVDANVARGASSAYGVFASAIELGLGNAASSVLSGLGVPVKTVASKAVSRMIANGSLRSAAATFGVRWLSNMFGNGAEEFLQSLGEDGATAIAYALDDLGAPKTVKESVVDAYKAGLSGVAGSFFLGGAGAGLETRIDAKKGIFITEKAQTIHSEEAYRKTVDAAKPEDISDSDWEALIQQAWNINAEARDLSWSASSYREAAGATIADGAVYDSSGRAYEASDKGIGDGNLFFQESTRQTSSGTVHTVKFGNTEQIGKGAVEYDYEQRKAIGEDISEEDEALALSERGKKYISKIGEITYRTTDSGKMEILSSSMGKGYEAYEKRALQQVIEMYPEYDVQWNNPGEKQAIYDEIASENPQGIEKGLNYGNPYDSEDTQAVKRWLGEHFSSDDAENSVMAILVQSAAKRMSLTGKQFIDKYSTDIREIDAATEAEIRKMGKNPDLVKGFTKPIQDGTRAVIYAAKNADVTTFQHELNHVLMAIGENKADFEKAFHAAIGSKGGLKRLVKFVEQNVDIIKSATKDGKFDPSIIENLYQRKEGDTRDWTRLEEEFEDELYEAYHRKGETLNPELKGVMRRIAETFRRVYRALRNSLGVSLNEEIRDYYDRLYGFDKDGVDKGRNFSSWAYKPNLSLTQEENDAIKDKSYAEQFAYIRDKYVGTEEYMRAPNGKASNLTENQWIMVRTPNFKEWFGDWENDPENASKVVDENGEPREVYHGSDNDFDVFDINMARANMDIQGLYFSSDMEESMGYGNNISKVFLNIRKPADSSISYSAFKSHRQENNAGIKTREDIEAQGYDGIISVDDEYTEYVAFDSNQIKSATDNSGAFSAENNSILFKDSEDGSNSIDNALLPVEDAIKKLRKELKSFKINPADWQDKHIAEFYNAYPEALIKAIKEYPKVLYDNVLMFAGLNEKMMPYKKEVIEGKIIQEIFGNNCIVLPLNVKPINNLFRIDLNESFPDVYMVSFNDNGFIELKHTKSEVQERLAESKEKKQLGFPFVFPDGFDSNFLDIWYSGKEFDKIGDYDFAAIDLANRKIYLQIKKGTPWEFLSQALGRVRALDRPRAENKVVTAGTESIAVQQRLVVEIETTPTLESYINEHENVNKKEHISHEEYLKAPRSARLFQEESPQNVWLEDIAYIANGCTDYEQFRIAVEAFAMGEPTENAEEDMERAFNARSMAPAASYESESIDFFGGDDDDDEMPVEYEYYLDANGEEMDLYGERDYEMFDEEAEEFIVASWAMARDADNETAEEAKATLENPPRMMNDRAAAFVDILSDDQQLRDYLSALRNANYIVQYGSERDLDFDPRENPERYTMLGEASKAIQESVAPFIRNVVFVKKGDTGEVKSISEKGMQIIRGIIRKNADEYMNLYYLATGNETWKKGYDADLDLQKEADRIASEKGLSISEKRSIVQDLRDKALEDKILRTGEVTSEDVRGLLSRNRKRSEIAKQEADLAKKMVEERLAFKNGQLIQLTLKAQQAEESLLKASTELSEVNDKLERTASRLARRAKGMGIDTKLVQEQSRLASRKAYLERLIAQRSNILKNLFNEGKYYGDAGTRKISEIDAQMGKILKEIVELEQSDVLTTDEAVERIIELTAEIRDEKARQRLYKTVTLERWKGAKKLKEAQEKADRKLRDTIYVERLKASKAKAAAAKEANSRLQGQRIHDAIFYGRMINRRDKAIERLKEEKRQEKAALRLKREMTRLATSIMRAPSSSIHLDEAEQILRIQATIDPAFRKTMKVAGAMMDINDLKDMLKNDPGNPLLTMLSEDQLRRLLKKSLDEMNLAELEAIAATVKNLREKGRAKRMEYVIQQRIETANLQALLIAQVMKSGKYKDPEIHGSFEERERGKSEKWKSIYYSTYNMARLSQMLDDGTKGSFYSLLVRRKRELQDVEARAILARRKPVEDAMEQNGISYEDLYRESIETVIDGKKATFSLSQLAYVYLSKNNEKNRAAVAYGNLISQAEKANAKNGVNARIIGEGKDFDKARNEAIDEEIRIIGDRRYAELYEYAREAIEARPAIKAAVEAIEASLNSDRFSEVVELMRREFNEEVTREAYYLPLNRTGFVGESPADRLKADILNQVPGMRASVDKGMTKERITISPRHQTEVDLDLAKVWDNSIYDQEHLLAFLEYTRQLDHVFKGSQNERTRELREALENSYGSSMLKRIDSYINEVANPSSAAIANEMSAASRIVKAGRTGIYAATFGLRVSSVLNQLITSPAAFLGKASPLDMARSSLMMMAHPLQTWKEITELSTFMLNRDADVVMRMIQEYNSQQGLSDAKRMHGKALEISMLGMKWADRFAVSIGWHAIYTKELNAALESGMTEAEARRKAVRIADEYVQETQPQGDITEQSELVKSDTFSIIAPFQTALNTVWQNVTYDIPAAFKEGRYAEAIGTAMGYVIAGVLLALVKGELAPQEDDENEGLMLARRILSASTSQFTEVAPLVGDTLSWIVNLAITGEKDYIYNSSTMPLLESLRTFASRVNDREWLKAVESVLYGTGQYFGAPVSEIKDIKRAFEEDDWRAIIGWRN